MELFLKQIAVALNYQQELLIFGLLLARIMPMVIQTPYLGGKLVPSELKMGLGIILAIILRPLVAPTLSEEIRADFMPYLGLMMKEIFIGFVLGFVNSHVFTVVEMAGRFIDTGRGSSMAEVLVPESGGRATPFGDLYYQLLLCIFVAMGAHSIFLDAFFMSFASIPIGTGGPFTGDLWPFTNYMMQLCGQVLLASVLLSAPIQAAVLITDVVFGILNRVAPQLNAYFMAMPVKAMGGVILAVVVMDTFAGRLADYVVWSLQTVEKTISLLVR
jgi:flagellar biosynthesis protein FliR